MRYIYLSIFFLFSFLAVTAQESNLRGRITDADTKEGVDFATVYLKDTSFVVETDLNGYYRISVPNDQKYTISVSRVGYKDFEKEMQRFRGEEKRNLDIGLVPETMDIKVVVRESRIKDAEMVTEEVSALKLLPSTTGNLESVLPNIALGANSGTGGELSSQYNVRGGNYDENLVYVNDFEIYRPQLIRAGQQEGLTFANIDLVRDLSFSSGGFQAKYGDKLSSVLNVKYKRPDSLAASVGGSFLGGSAHIEGSMSTGDDYRKIRYLIGARYKTTRYLLGTLDTEGEYIPNFADIQGYFTYDITRNWQLAVLGNFNQSIYNFIPQSRSTALGLVNFGLELNTTFTGQEADDFTNGLGGVSMTYIPDREKNPIYLKFLSSTYRSSEVETIDIIGDYLLGEIETSLGNDDAGEIVNVLGTGVQHQFVRNYLFLEVYNAEHKGGIEIQVDREDAKDVNHFVQWGVKYQKEIIQDEINEWERLDSAGFSLPFDENEVLLDEVLKTQNALNSNRFSGFIQETYSSKLDNVREWQLTLGLRANYWDLNEELVISPRAQFLYKPLNTLREVSYKLSAGLYAQPALYRELRRPDGTINTDLRSQKSAHIVGGITYDFYLGKIEKPFRFIAEAYYKQLWDLVSFDIDNVRIRYSGENDATGYAAGLDLRVNGEFVKGAESWINLSFLRTRERLNGVEHKDRERGSPEVQIVDDVARPTDQLMTLSVFFQDYLRDNDNIRTHLNISVGTGFPFGLPRDNIEFRNTFRFSPYHRVDIGFSFALWNRDRILKRPNHFLKFTKSTWLSLEVFNLLAVSNAASNTWVRTVFNTEFAIPNFLTGRRINLRLKMDF
jgi:hypothetical protein